MLPRKPFEQRAGIVQPHSNFGMALQMFDERQVGALVDVLEHGIEIADRLVAVDQENETELAQI